MDSQFEIVKLKLEKLSKNTYNTTIGCVNRLLGIYIFSGMGGQPGLSRPREPMEPLMNHKANLAHKNSAEIENDSRGLFPKSFNIKREAELEYLSDMLPQLRMMALGLEEPMLAYYLEMAMMEAHLQLEITRFQSEKD